ncbi:MAG: aldehyde dehydrogenase (NADP(+)) [Euzebya sp.]
MSSSLHAAGVSLIAGTPTEGDGGAFTSTAPQSGPGDRPTFRSVTEDQMDAAVAAAATARRGPIDTVALAHALQTAAAGFETHADTVVAVADSESALGEARLTGELARTVGQLRMMAAEAVAGARRDTVVDPAGPTPAEPGLFRTRIPIGVVGVFAASNFPLAFGVAGTDTAAALAAGCPVVAKAHPAQPATAELCGRLITAGIAEAGLDAGMYSVIHEEGHVVGQALVGHPEVAAIAFTGSHRGGRALFDLAAARPQPIPVYAEMGSLNPVLVSPGAASERPEELVQTILGSCLLGEGQFCTKPGLVILPAGENGERVAEGLAQALKAHRPSHPLLYPGIDRGFEQGVRAIADLDGVRLVSAPKSGQGTPAVLCHATVAAVVANSSLRQELFGPATVVVVATDAQMRQLIEVLDPALTATLQVTDDEDVWTRSMADLLARKVGRVIRNGMPTGVRVSPAQHHGGPYPATTSPLHTSVGLAAIDRFLRPVTFQSFETGGLPTWAKRPAG